MVLALPYNGGSHTHGHTSWTSLVLCTYMYVYDDVALGFVYLGNNNLRVACYMNIAILYILQ